jgi:HD-GYP domain-containing protein (c-di-GMP phosphodiesterase class II)
MYTGQWEGDVLEGAARRSWAGASAQRPVLVAHASDLDRRVLAAAFDTGEHGSCLSVGAVDDLLALAPRAGVIVLDPLLGTGMADTLALLRERHPALPVVILSSRHCADEMRQALQFGACSYAATPIAGERLRRLVATARAGHAMVETHLVNPSLLPPGAGWAHESSGDRAAIESLAAAMEAKDTLTGRHVRHAAALAVQLARVVDPELAASEDFWFGCMLHDIGKIGVPERILNKPGPLDAGEWHQMRRHPQTGARVIGPLRLASTACEIVLHHHERWDGGGYPAGLAGTEIPLGARIFAVCDALEAMTSDRPYRPALDLEEALRRLHADAGRQFDPDVVAALDRALVSGRLDLGGPIVREGALV